LSLALAKLGGPVEAVDVSETPLRLDPVAPTFHGRDIFAPVAAHLASGHPLAAAGEAMDPSNLVALEIPEARIEEDTLVAQVLYADSFGNVILNARSRSLPAGGDALTVTIAGADHPGVRGVTFADGDGGLVAYEDSSGRLGIALDGGSAAEALGAGRDAELRIAAA
jgi:S-adenosylmethionine hydrolase